jgi:hypothetical protein
MHDTSEFAINSIYQWWSKYVKKLYPDSTKIYMVADCGGSNGYRVNLWKFELFKMATKINMPVQVSHLPPGTSKWNKIEHKLFSFISTNWKGQQLENHETVVKLISNTKTAAGLKVACRLNRNEYEKGV